MGILANVHPHFGMDITGQEASSASGAQATPNPRDVERLLSKLQKKDLHNIFRDPVTDALVG